MRLKQDSDSFQALNPRSARRYNPREDRQKFGSSVEAVTTVQMTTVPVFSVDTKFKDQEKRYNDAVYAYNNLRVEIYNLKTYFKAETSGIPVLEECFRILAHRCGDAKIMIEIKSNTFLEVFYDPQDVSEKCTVSPEQVLEPLSHYKSAFKHAKDVLQHAPQIKENISTIINDEQVMLKEIAEADLPRDKELDGMRSVMSNIKQLKQMKLKMDDMQRLTEQTCEELMDASKPLCF